MTASRDASALMLASMKKVCITGAGSAKPEVGFRGWGLGIRSLVVRGRVEEFGVGE
jgi:hypothetical protein